VEPFRVHVGEDTLADLRDRLARTRWPDQLDGASWDYGTELGYLRALCAYWQSGFDWHKQEALLNQIPQFTADISGMRVHFLHARSPHARALPLIITHGWPGSIFEFYKIIGPLTEPEKFGGHAEDAFHVVAPSMPGYGFSTAPRAPGFNIRRVAETHVRLMEVLDYAHYGVQGGDWGSVASAWAAHLAPERVCGAHMNMTLGRKPEDTAKATVLTPEELKRLDDARKFRTVETGYQAIQGTKPQTLGYGLTDSPAGLAAWIVEKFRTWSDCGGNVESRFTKDELLTNIMIYWINGNIASSTRLYYETLTAGMFGAPPGRTEVPSGFALFPGELVRLPRSWCEETFNVVHWTEMPRGGHFAALEEPGLLVDDIRAFFRPLR
jgi:pimeloyl-ACP methyl ester carboxylesterase